MNGTADVFARGHACSPEDTSVMLFCGWPIELDIDPASLRKDYTRGRCR